VAELEELATEREVQLKTAWGEHAAWKARANDMSKHYQDQAARAELAESEVARLREALAAADEENGRLQRKVMKSDKVAEAAEARVRELATKLTAAQAALSVSQEAGAQLLAERDAAERRAVIAEESGIEAQRERDAANALLRMHVSTIAFHSSGDAERIRAHLSAQPATCEPDLAYPRPNSYYTAAYLCEGPIR